MLGGVFRILQSSGWKVAGTHGNGNGNGARLSAAARSFWPKNSRRRLLDAVCFYRFLCIFYMRRFYFSFFFFADIDFKI